MKLRKDEQKTIAGQIETKKPRFKIEKLEERIAPHHRVDHDGGGGGDGGGGPPCRGGVTPRGERC